MICAMTFRSVSNWKKQLGIINQIFTLIKLIIAFIFLTAIIKGFFGGY